ncbi:MAG TPA: ubiquinol-cytochrome c reductase iron-sulfur subunit [Planctomycetaceae bacterium]|nr:ubiquinol-cytochrome c reductase iron-sulfur subunit [Planctomycetaceae bacterium]
MAKKLSTSDILKAARAQAGQGEAPPAAPAEAVAPPEAATPEPAAPPAETVAPAPAPAAPASSAAPKSTKDILAAARAQSGGAAPSAPAAPKATPAKAPAAPAAGGGSTKDILAAARAQSAAGAAPAGGAKSTSDILAAARAQSGKAATPAAPKVVGEKPTKVAAAPAAAAPGARPSVQEMLKAAREGKGTAMTVAAPNAVATVKPAAAPLVIPKKPSAKAAPAEVEPRRGFLAGTAWVLFGSPFRLAWTAFAATMGLGGLATARFMMPNVLVEPPSKFKVGPPSDYPPASVATKWTAQYGVWLVHNEFNGKDLIYALQTVCTHLGCTPNWLEGERKFKCPCHGSGFYITGINFEGPAPRPLERMAIRLSEDGALEVDKSRKFQQELGQWNDPASFVEVA